MNDSELMVRLEKEFRFAHRRTGRQGYAQINYPYAEKFDDKIPGLGYVTTFHAEAVKMLTVGDHYFCGIRAEHFVVEYGYSEEQQFCPDDWRPGDVLGSVLISANHKGYRSSIWFPNKDKAIEDCFKDIESHSQTEREWPVSMPWIFDYPALLPEYRPFAECGPKHFPTLLCYLLRFDPEAAVVLTHVMLSVGFLCASIARRTGLVIERGEICGHGLEGSRLQKVTAFCHSIFPAVEEIQKAPIPKTEIKDAEQILKLGREDILRYLERAVADLPVMLRDQAEPIVAGMKIVEELNRRVPKEIEADSVTDAVKNAEAVAGFVPLYLYKQLF